MYYNTINQFTLLVTFATLSSGFDTLRIPVAWTNTMNFEDGDYTISKEYLGRVKEIVNYAIKADMYVIVNDHWDGSWWGMFGSENLETREKAMDLYISMWEQIANEFKNYSNKLIFESANEELGSRLNDINVAADSGSLSEDECYTYTNLINQTFVNTIRGAKGNNRDRFLLIAGYNTNIEATVDHRFIMPEDSAENKLLVSVHYYDPWSYCGTESITQWGSTDEYTYQNETLAKMTKFTKQGYGVVIGEYGALPLADNSLKGNTLDFTNNILDNSDLYGFVPMLWDCGTYFDKSQGKMRDQSFGELFISRSYSNNSELSETDIKKKAMKSLEIALKESENYTKDIPVLDPEGKAVAWIMFASGDWGVSYSVGDQYSPTTISDGVKATDVEITGEGEYRVKLDFTGSSQGHANSVSFSALGISNGELLFPGYFVNIKKILINDQEYQPVKDPFTSSDDGICTRVNIYNEWVGEVPAEARISTGDLSNAGAIIIEKSDLKEVETIEILFDYVK